MGTGEEQGAGVHQHEQLEEAGRGTDTTMAHMSLGEIVIPRAMQDDPRVMEFLKQAFEAMGADINEFTVGHEANKINPETGYPEFGFGSFLKKAFKVAAPLALSYFAPGIGTAIGGSLLGAGAAGSATLGSALLGGGIGALTGGGLKGALTGAALGGIGANIGTAAGSTLKGGAQGATQGSGILGAVTRNVPSGLTNTLRSAVGGGSSSFSPLSTVANIYSGVQGQKTNEKTLRAQLDANAQAQAALEGFKPEDYINSDEYKFAVNQGQQGLDRASAARGGFYSGRALQDASKFNQSLGNQFYNSAYDKFANKTNTKIGLLTGAGDIRANSGVAGSNILNQSLANILGSRVGNADGTQYPQYDQYGRRIA